MTGQPFYGKYRGTVLSNSDPLMLGRIQVSVPDLADGAGGSWAMPCMPVAGQQMGSYMLPPVGADVWVEFERGDPDYPIWVGGFWGATADIPASALAGEAGRIGVVLQTTAQNCISISDSPDATGGIVLRSAAGATIVVNDSGIFIDNGKGASIVMTGPSVTVNGGALVVT